MKKVGFLIILIVIILSLYKNKSDRIQSNCEKDVPVQVCSLGLDKEFKLAKSTLYNLYAWNKLTTADPLCSDNLIPLNIDIVLDTVNFDKKLNSIRFYFHIYDQFDINRIILCKERGIHSIWVNSKDKSKPFISHWGFNDYVVFKFTEMNENQLQEIQLFYDQNQSNLSSWIKNYNLDQ